MAVNKYFKNFYNKNEARISEDLIIEAIKMYGVDIQYMPRTVFNEDLLFGGDPLSRFTQAVPIEMYINNIQSLDGEGDFLSKFNLEIRDSMKLTMARRRWKQITSEKLVDETGYNYQLETANTIYFANSDSILLETGTANGYSVTSTRPLEGDLLYVPFMNNAIDDNNIRGTLYEIKHVEHESIFYQLGQLYTYVLSCDLFSYSSEKILTGNTIIDTIETRYSADVLNFQFFIEGGTDKLLDEDGGWLLQEYDLVTINKTANNTTMHDLADDYVNFSEHNPFSERDRG